MSIRSQTPGDGAPFPAVEPQLPPWWLLVLFLVYTVGAVNASFREGRTLTPDPTLREVGAALLRILAWPFFARWGR